MRDLASLQRNAYLIDRRSKRSWHHCKIHSAAGSATYRPTRTSSRSTGIPYPRQLESIVRKASQNRPRGKWCFQSLHLKRLSTTSVTAGVSFTATYIASKLDLSRSCYSPRSVMFTLGSYNLANGCNIYAIIWHFRRFFTCDEQFDNEIKLEQIS